MWEMKTKGTYSLGKDTEFNTELKERDYTFRICVWDCE